MVEAFCDDEDELWLGKTLPFGDFNPRSPCCCKKYTGTQKTKYGTRFNDKDYMVAVQWYERLTESGNGERREFVRGERAIDVINSTELRGVGVRVEKIGALSAGERGNDPEALAKWELSRDDEAEALTWCR